MKTIIITALVIMPFTAMCQNKKPDPFDKVVEIIRTMHKIDSLELRFANLKAEYYRTGKEKYRTMAFGFITHFIPIDHIQ